MELIEAIRAFPARREVTHCGETFFVSPFDIYAECPHCGVRLKVRSFSSVSEIEDVFDAVFEWMNQANADGMVHRRRVELQQDQDN